MVWQCLMGEGDLKKGRQTVPNFDLPLANLLWVFESSSTGITSSPLQRGVSSLARDVHGFKVQLVVEFYIYPLCLDHSQTQNIFFAKTPEQAHQQMSRPPPRAGSIVSLPGKAAPVSSSAADSPPLPPPPLCPVLFPQIWEVHLAAGVQFFTLWLKDGAPWTFFSFFLSFDDCGLEWGGANLAHRKKTGAAVVWSTSFHISPQ